jgi:hypothetical protein
MVLLRVNRNDQAMKLAWTNPKMYHIQFNLTRLAPISAAQI